MFLKKTIHVIFQTFFRPWESSQVNFKRVCDHRQSHARKGLPSAPKLPSVRRGIQQAPVLRNNRACCLHGVRKTSGALHEFARDSAVKNWRVSDDQRPPTSPLKTTRRHLPSSPDSSGYVRTLRFPASTSVAPSLVVALAMTVPSLLRALTRVASVARCAIPNIARPSATTSSRQLVEILQVHVADEHVATSGHALHRETPPTQHLCRCTARRWPKTSSGRPHLKLHCDKGGSGGEDGGAAQLGETTMEITCHFLSRRPLLRFVCVPSAGVIRPIARLQCNGRRGKARESWTTVSVSNCSQEQGAVVQLADRTEGVPQSSLKEKPLSLRGVPRIRSCFDPNNGTNAAQICFDPDAKVAVAPDKPARLQTIIGALARRSVEVGAERTQVGRTPSKFRHQPHTLQEKSPLQQMVSELPAVASRSPNSTNRVSLLFGRGPATEHEVMEWMSDRQVEMNTTLVSGYPMEAARISGLIIATKSLVPTPVPSSARRRRGEFTKCRNFPAKWAISHVDQDLGTPVHVPTKCLWCALIVASINSSPRGAVCATLTSHYAESSPTHPASQAGHRPVANPMGQRPTVPRSFFALGWWGWRFTHDWWFSLWKWLADGPKSLCGWQRLGPGQNHDSRRRFEQAWRFRNHVMCRSKVVCCFVVGSAGQARVRWGWASASVSRGRGSDPQWMSAHHNCVIRVDEFFWCFTHSIVAKKKVAGGVQWTATLIALWHRESGGGRRRNHHSMGNNLSVGQLLWAQWTLFGFVWEKPSSKTVSPLFSHLFSNTKWKIVFLHPPSNFSDQSRRCRRSGASSVCVMMLTLLECQWWQMRMLWYEIRRSSSRDKNARTNLLNFLMTWIQLLMAFNKCAPSDAVCHGSLTFVRATHDWNSYLCKGWELVTTTSDSHSALLVCQCDWELNCEKQTVASRISKTWNINRELLRRRKQRWKFIKLWSLSTHNSKKSV